MVIPYYAAIPLRLCGEQRVVREKRSSKHELRRVKSNAVRHPPANVQGSSYGQEAFACRKVQARACRRRPEHAEAGRPRTLVDRGFPLSRKDLPLRPRAHPGAVVHARGYGAHGFSRQTSLAKYTRADIFQRAGEKTPAFVRFSTVAGNKGSFDLARDVRGFAVKLYTKEGNWDLVGNNIPVFFIQDAIKFPDLIHAAKQEPDRAFPQAQTAHDNFWDFISLMPESMHMIMWIMSDRAIPRSFRFMQGFGVHTFRLVNAKDESTFVKFIWKPKLGMQSVVWNEAVKINGADPDFHRRDLWDAIRPAISRNGS
jgi:hypothetical protein